VQVVWKRKRKGKDRRTNEEGGKRRAEKEAPEEQVRKTVKKLLL
jgi:hypothetical protein